MFPFQWTAASERVHRRRLRELACGPGRAFSTGARPEGGVLSDGGSTSDGGRSDRGGSDGGDGSGSDGGDGSGSEEEGLEGLYGGRRNDTAAAAAVPVGGCPPCELPVGGATGE
jgi:hypothetical protein